MTEEEKNECQKEILLMLSLNVVNFAEPMNKEIKEYVKCNFTYTDILSNELKNYEDNKSITQKCEQILERLRNMLFIITSAKKSNTNISYYRRVLWDISQLIKYYQNYNV